MNYLADRRLIVLYFLLITSIAFSQDVYHTRSAQIVIKVRHHGHVSEFWSDRLDILLDYSDATFVANLQKENLLSDDQLLTDELAELTDKNFELSGKFGLDYIETDNHSPMQFEYKGTLSYAENDFPVEGIGRLEHIDGGYITCLLNFKFTLKGDILPNELMRRHSVEDISVEVLQSILKPKVN